jgi:hypothetical protein
VPRTPTIFLLLAECARDAANEALPETKKKTTRMKIIKHIHPKIRSRLPSLLVAAAVLALNTLPALAQSTTFSSTDLKTGISNSLAVIMMFGFRPWHFVRHLRRLRHPAWRR